jgi:translation initiation factor 1
MSKKKRISVEGEPIRWKSPFTALKNVAVAPASVSPQSADQPAAPPIPTTSRGRVDIFRSRAHRGGKTVTVVTGFVGISQAEKERLAKAMQQACGAGGTVKEGRIEIQGDQRQAVARILTDAGFRPVFAGG